ncbi:patatin-like phospholipase family protein [Neoroseomonas soli]|uniref:patatin-like phospholipase family protein n=1 Tax=Neoroseomonas soli TaxID=1081025 RepID=UPI001BAC0E56
MTGRRGIVLGAGAMLAGCGLLPRGSPVPVRDIRDATVLGLHNERFCVADHIDLPRMIEEFNEAGRRQRRFLGLGPREPLPDGSIIAFSGGGENGAFGAGLACGWTARGNRPRFNVVTGISTGALTAPLVFAGPHRDDDLRAAYTAIAPSDILERHGWLALLSEDSLADSAPLAHIIAHYMDERLLAEIAEGYRAGRQLVIATTNLDAQRPVAWNIGAIAESGHPRALALVRQVLLASASVPGLFSPVMIDVTVNGRPHQEMHVDGGTYAQAYLYPPGLGESRTERIRAGLTPPNVTAYVVRNGWLHGRGGPVRRSILAITGQAISTLITAAGVGDIFRIQAAAARHGIAFRLAHIDDDFTEPAGEAFATEFLRALFDYGYAKARDGYPWKDALPP